MVAVEPMGGVISCRAQVMEENCHLTLDKAIELQPPNQGQLRLLGARERSKPGRHLLGQPFTQLPQLDQRRIGILWEIALRQDPQPEQLFVVAAQLGKVGAHNTATHWRIFSAIKRRRSTRKAS